MTAKQTYTDVAKGVARQSDWITGCELSCFGGEGALSGGAQLSACLRSYAAFHPFWINRSAESSQRVALQRSIYICENTRAGRCTAEFSHGLMCGLLVDAGRKLWTCFSEVLRMQYATTVTTALSSPSGLWIMFLWDCNLA